VPTAGRVRVDASTLVRALPYGISCTAGTYERTSRCPSGPFLRRQAHVISCKEERSMPHDPEAYDRLLEAVRPCRGPGLATGATRRAASMTEAGAMTAPRRQQAPS